MFNKCLTVVCNFLQCDYCQIENVSMDFSSPLVTENSFQITRLRLVIWKEFSVTCGEEKPILTFPPDSNLSLCKHFKPFQVGGPPAPNDGRQTENFMIIFLVKYISKVVWCV